MIPLIEMLWSIFTATTLLGTSASSALSASSSESRGKRSYAERTAARRRRTQQLLDSIAAPTWAMNLENAANAVPILEEAPSLDWSCCIEFDPQQNGNLQKDTPRSKRKRVQVEAFLHICQQLLLQDDAESIVDAGSGAGNLAIPLYGILQRHVLAIDMNPVALQRLEDRVATTKATTMRNNKGLVSTLCADLADSVTVCRSMPCTAGVVCSLHGCGAATDMAIRLATHRRIPFVMSPCCNGKANVQRPPPATTTTTASTAINKHGLRIEGSFYPKSGAPEDISYPRSKWLYHALEAAEGGANATAATSPEEFYVTLAKVADVGLGPQTPEEQREHQRLAKYVVEMDRLMAVVEEHDYRVQLYRLKDHEGYGKAEIFVGVPKEHPAACTMEWMK